MRSRDLYALDGTIIYVGAGRCPDLGELLATSASSIVLVEPNAKTAQSLRHLTKGDPRVEVACTAVGPQYGKGVLRTFTVAGMESLTTTTPNQDRFPGIQELSTQEVPVSELRDFIQSRCSKLARNLIVIDAPGVETHLAGALDENRNLDLVVLVRTSSIWRDCGMALPWSEIVSRLLSVGFHATDFSSATNGLEYATFERHRSLNIPPLFYEKRGKLIDKWTSYLSRYNENLSDRAESVKSLLEIGVQNGGSMDVWLRCFSNLEVAVGVDVDEKCRELEYDDPRINIVVGPAEHPATVETILNISPNYDLVIDDGSHVSEHVVKNFAAYFPRLNDGGLYIVEDVHTSYWKKFGGGLSNEDSQMSFFKSLTDVVNQEHWSDIAKIVSIFGAKSESLLKEQKDIEEALKSISEIRFVNSMVFIYKNRKTNRLGTRIVRGEDARVTDIDWHKRVAEGASVKDMNHSAVW